MHIIDAHEDISTNVLYATNKDIQKRNSLHEGTNSTGLAVNNNVDVPRMREGDVKVVFASIFSIDHELVKELAQEKPENYNFSKVFLLKTGLAGALEQLGLYHELCNRIPDLSHLASKRDYKNLEKTKQIGLIFHCEGIDYVTSEQAVDALIAFGIRSIALTWRNQNALAGGNNATTGLSKLGRTMAKYIASKPVVFDLAHANKQTFWDVAKSVDIPLIVSHTLCNAITQNTRNLDDEQIKAIATTGGVVCMAAIPDYIGGDTIEDYVRHFSHVVELVGIDHVGFGTDFDGLVDLDDRFIKGFEDASQFPNVIKGLLKAGFSRAEVEKIAYKNLERIILARLPNK